MFRELSRPQPLQPFVVREDAQLQDRDILMESLLEASAHARQSVDGSGFARLFEAAYQVIQQQAAENKVQRGLAIASQTLASELAIKCEQLQSLGALPEPQLQQGSPPQPQRALDVAPAPQQATPIVRRSTDPGSLPAVR